MPNAEKNRLADLLTRPLSIAGRPVANRLWLAPMAGLTHVAYREVLEEYGGCGLLFTEMCSAKGVPTENRNVSPVFRWRDEELHRLVCQVVGADPGELLPAVRRVEDEGFFGVDINMGCSAPGIVKRNSGAALLRDPGAALAAVEAVRREVSIPLFVKFRTGWTRDVEPAATLARRFEEAGVDCLVFHPRVAPDKRTRPPVREHIRAIKEAVSIPVLGNGDVVTPSDCLEMLETTGCDGVSVGRMAVARPWLFAEWTGGPVPDEACFRDYALRLADLLDHYFDPIRALKRFRLFTVYFAANFTYGHSLQSRFLGAKSMDEVRDVVREHVKPGMQLVSRPNMNMYNT
ncbi:tRNA-dihydrouridine synthase family protein [Pseudodesulfovibrio cashew]|uniref:tRNA-dihydrouridine synthase n=1 Tax=Pseudodesulfovibrio cashew TaxID=2678688 RepID=A0A6I6JEV1_9BACT|nr:tRNA-dihydrouridine synthase family protein [Pseudodesulfovibrio cashew]QGY39699.1 tRNA-dihydrouridine synthase family protein [Pseudodesulfovibrio cashew]